METLPLESVVAILGIVIPAIAGLLGVKWQQAKGAIKDVSHGAKVVQIKTRQASVLLETLSVALEDDKITANEAKLIAAQLKALIRGLDENEV